MALNAPSMAKKKRARSEAMIITMIVVRTVSCRVGQTTFAVSARTCRMNSPGEVFATSSNLAFQIKKGSAARWSRPAELGGAFSAGAAGVQVTLAKRQAHVYLAAP